jgi:hypothetical protein
MSSGRRVAKAWMDEYASFYFKMNRRARAAAERQDVSQRLALRRQMGCRSFAWYLDTVWPEHFLPRPGRFFGRLESVGRPGRCLQKPDRRPGSHSSQPAGPAALQAGDSTQSPARSTTEYIKWMRRNVVHYKFRHISTLNKPHKAK